jgi:hypothetical protein
MTSSPHCPYALGYTHATMVETNSCEAAMRSQSEKLHLSSDCRLKLADMKLESLVTVCQQGTVNTFSDLVHTARQAMGVGGTRIL